MKLSVAILALGLAIVPTLASAKTYKTEKSCVKHMMVWKNGKCHKA